MYYNFFLKFWIFQKLKFDLIFRFMNMIVVMVLVNIIVMVIMMLVIILTVMIIMMTIIILMMTIIGMEMIKNTWLVTETAIRRSSGEEGGALYHGWENTVMEEYLHPCPSSGRFNHIDIDVNIDVSIFWC